MPNKGLYSCFPTKAIDAKFLTIIIDILLLKNKVKGIFKSLIIIAII